MPEPTDTVLPLWAEWTIGASTVVFGLAAVTLAVVTIWLAVKTKAVAAETKAISEWERHNQQMANFKQRLEQRVGHAHSVLGEDALHAIIRRFPRSPGEFSDERQARRQRESHGDAEEFESLVFTKQADGGWTLEVVWGSYESVEDAYTDAAAQYQLSVVPPPPGVRALSLWSVGPTHLLVTRPAGTGEPA